MARCTAWPVGLLLLPVFVRFVLVRDRCRSALLTINPCGPYGLAQSKIVMAGPPALSPRPTSSAAWRGRRQQQVLDQEQYWSRQATLSARVVLGRSSPVPSLERGKGESSPSSPRRAANDSLPSPGAATPHGAVSKVSGASPAASPTASTAVIRVPGWDYPVVPLPLLKRPTTTRDDLMRMCRDRVLSFDAAENKTRLIQILTKHFQSIATV